MTRRQVRAAMRRIKIESDEIDVETNEINLVPYMDIVTNIIIFLLASVVQQVPLGNINVSSPTLGSGPSDNTTEPETPPLNPLPPDPAGVDVMVPEVVTAKWSIEDASAE